MSAPGCSSVLGFGGLLAGLLAAALPGQQAAPKPAPDITWRTTFNFGTLKNQKLSQLRGSAVLLEFWGTNATSCKRQVPRLNELHQRLFRKGLVVVGVTGEDTSDIEPWLKQNDVRYPIALGWEDKYDVRGIPDDVLIDPKGDIVWRGHPDKLEESVLLAALAGARPATLAPELVEASKLRESGKVGDGYRQLQDLLAAGSLPPEAATQAKAMVAEIVQQVAAAIERALATQAQDPYAAYALLDDLQRNHVGIPRADESKALIAQLSAEPKAKREIQAGCKFAECQALDNDREYDAAYKAYKQMDLQFHGSKFAKQALAAAEAIEKSHKLGFKKSCSACQTCGFACTEHRRKK